ncbi:MAG: entericidin A/B family lipoprotein [Akkermansiaceae bacterium]
MTKIISRKSGLGLIILGALAFLTPSCQTVAGAGRDLQNAGEAITGSAQR